MSSSSSSFGGGFSSSSQSLGGSSSAYAAKEQHHNILQGLFVAKSRFQDDFDRIGHKEIEFLDLGCAPGGFSEYSSFCH